MNRPSWDEYFLTIAKIVSTRATCNSRHNGCIIVKDKQILSTGYNGSMPGCDHCIDKMMPDGSSYCERRALNVSDIDKYNFCVGSHAESNAVAQAARLGISLKNSTAYCTLSPCFNCLKTLVVAGVKEVVYEYEYGSKDKGRDKYWKEQMEKAGVKYKELRLSPSALYAASKALDYPTSKRILKATD